MADATVFMDCRRVFMGVNVGGNRCDGSSHLWVGRHVDDDGLGVGHAQLRYLPQGVGVAFHFHADLVQ